MENKNFVEKKEVFKNYLTKVYKLVHNKEPIGLENWQIAEKVIEVLDNQNWVPNDMAKECIFEIVHGEVEYPDDDTKQRIILAAEDSAPSIFPELAHITGGVHMDQIEYLYYKWKKKVH